VNDNTHNSSSIELSTPWSHRVDSIRKPPIAEVYNAARDLEKAGREIIRLGQAVPWFGPPDWALEQFIDQIHEPAVSRYSPDPGFPELRILLSERWFGNRGFFIDPLNELHITVGASQAFMSALTTVADSGNMVVLSDPYYFDHLYAVQFLDCLPHFVPMRETDDGFSYDVNGTIEAIKNGARVVVLVHPSNPTATVIPASDLQRIAISCARHRCYLILDETYERFLYDQIPAWHPWMDKETRPWCLTIGSFSKTFGMAGWRIGYLFGPASLLEQALKVQDSVAICAPVPAQFLLKIILNGPVDKWLEVRIRELHRRRRLTEDTFNRPGSFLRWRQASGAFFTFLAYGSRRSSADIAIEILRTTGAALVPGSSFGSMGEYHLRLSFGSSTAEELDTALIRLLEYAPSPLA